MANEDGRKAGWGVYRKATPGPAPHEGTIYVVAGSSGQASGGKLLHPAMYAGLNILGSLVLDFDGLRLDSRFIDTNGLVRDYFTVVKGPQEANGPNQEGLKGYYTGEGGKRIPKRLGFLWQEANNRVGLTNANPADQELLLDLYKGKPGYFAKVTLT